MATPETGEILRDCKFPDLEGAVQVEYYAGARLSSYTAVMYARRLRVEVVVKGERKACPLEWLDAFCMRNFTGSAEFDDTLPIAEGEMEASLRVDPERFAEAFGEWLTKRGKGNGQEVQVEIHTQ